MLEVSSFTLTHHHCGVLHPLSHLCDLSLLRPQFRPLTKEEGTTETWSINWRHEVKKKRIFNTSYYWWRFPLLFPIIHNTNIQFNDIIYDMGDPSQTMVPTVYHP